MLAIFSIIDSLNQDRKCLCHLKLICSEWNGMYKSSRERLGWRCESCNSNELCATWKCECKARLCCKCAKYLSNTLHDREFVHSCISDSNFEKSRKNHKEDGYIFALCEWIEWNGCSIDLIYSKAIIGMSTSFISEIVSVTLELITFHIKLVQRDKNEIDCYLLWNPTKKIGKIIMCDLTFFHNDSNGSYDYTLPFMVDLLKNVGWDQIVAEGEKPLKKVKLDFL